MALDYSESMLRQAQAYFRDDRVLATDRSATFESHWGDRRSHQVYLEGSVILPTVYLEGSVILPTGFVTVGPAGAASLWPRAKQHRRHRLPPLKQPLPFPPPRRRLPLNATPQTPTLLLAPPPSSSPILCVRADIARLPFATGSVDAIHAGAAIHCWPNPQAALAEISRVLRPGGVFVASTFLTPFAPLGELVGDKAVRPISQVGGGWAWAGLLASVCQPSYAALCAVAVCFCLWVWP